MSFLYCFFLLSLLLSLIAPLAVIMSCTVGVDIGEAAVCKGERHQVFQADQSDRAQLQRVTTLPLYTRPLVFISPFALLPTYLRLLIVTYYIMSCSIRSLLLWTSQCLLSSMTALTYPNTRSVHPNKPYLTP